MSEEMRPEVGDRVTRIVIAENAQEPPAEVTERGTVIEVFEDGRYKFDLDSISCSTHFRDGPLSARLWLDSSGKWITLVDGEACEFDTFNEAHANLPAMLVSPDYSYVAEREVSRLTN